MLYFKAACRNGLAGTPLIRGALGGRTLHAKNPHGSEAARGKGNIKMEGVDLQLCYHQLFRARSVHPLTGLPTSYHLPQPHPFGHTPWFACLTASCLLRYSATFQSAGATQPICIRDNPKPAYAAISEQWIKFTGLRASPVCII